MAHGRASSLQIEDHTDFERHSALVARIFWLALLAIMLATLLGLFGGGPLSQASVRADDGSVRVSYERFARAHAATTLDVEVLPSNDGPASFALSRSYFDSLQIDSLYPEPAAMTIGADTVQFRFAPDGEPLRVHLQVRPIRRSRIEGRLRAAGREIRWWQFVYP